ncbi:glycyl-tRNA synthetase alpha subunit [Clostridium punense]|uniref:Glycyl-tRNA synthetase alpha subunit n=1 Tax=Clostridium punense TaxID=1054297 RepID=A0ABS4K9Q6_9CLOT|nr:MULTISPECIES: hypothetical protein [Clostridium]EQB89162.1 hypothetical protein M918_21530 [Clostridium sp. BL8]MBP2023911.1 glycyl-tRNA synthetase alpha subunit [Clostridium punense]
MNEKNIEMINEYNEIYTELLKNTTLFKRGVFSHYHAEGISQDLKNKGFFDANHEIALDGFDKSIKTSDDFNILISKERDKIFEDPKLQTKFNKINKELGKKYLTNFRTIIEKH